MRSPSRESMERDSTVSIFLRPPLRTPPTNPPWSFARSRCALFILAYSSADSGVRIVTFKRSFNSSKPIVLLTQVFACRLLPYARDKLLIICPSLPSVSDRIQNAPVLQPCGHNGHGCLRNRCICTCRIHG